MLTLLERQKEYVSEDLEKYSCAMVVTVAPEKIYYGFPKFEDTDSKEMVYRRVVDTAKIGERYRDHHA